MAILVKNPGESLALSEVVAFFRGKFDPAVAGVDGRSLSHYLRDGGIVLSVSSGGVAAVAEQFTVTPTGAITNPVTSAGTQVYQRTDFHGRLGRNSNGADNASTGPGTWGVYPDGSDFVNNNIAGFDIETTPLTVGTDYALIFNVQDQANNNIEATFEAFQVNDLMSIIRNNGGDSGNGYQFQLRAVPQSIEQNDGDTRNVIIAMDARVTRIFGDGTMTDQLLDSTVNDTLTVTRGVSTANPPTIRFQFDSSISPSTLDVTITAGQTTVAEQQEVIYTALGGVDGLTRVAAAGSVPEHITYDTAGARTDTTYSVVTAGAAGIDGNSYTIDTIQQGVNAGGAISYPATGGIALDDLGSVTHSGTNSWPNVAVDLMGMTSDATWTNDLDYVPGATTVFGSIINDTGQNLTLRNWTVSVTFDNLGTNSNLSYFMWIRRGSSNTVFEVPSRTITATGEQIHTASGTADWNNGVTLQFGIFSNSSGFTYTANYVRFNLSAEEEFAPTGGGGGGGGTAINQDIPTSSPLSLSQLRNVDDGET